MQTKVPTSAVFPSIFTILALNSTGISCPSARKMTFLERATKFLS